MPFNQKRITYDVYFAGQPNEAMIRGVLSALEESNRVARMWFERAQQAGDNRDEVLHSQVKSTEFSSFGYEDAFTQADAETEAVLIPLLKQISNVAVVAEESGHEVADCDLPDGSYRWLVDPIDGTFCFKNGSPDFSTTVAYQHKENGQWKTQIGAVSIPMSREVFLADQHNAYVIQGDRAKELFIENNFGDGFSGGTLESALKGKRIDLPIYSKTNPQINQASVNLRDHPAVTRTYSTAFSMSKMLDGWFDGVVAVGNAMDYPWDTDAAIHIAEVAGARVKRTQIEGEPMVILARSSETLTAAEQLVRREYERVKQAATGRGA